MAKGGVPPGATITIDQEAPVTVMGGRGPHTSILVADLSDCIPYLRGGSNTPVGRWPGELVQMTICLELHHSQQDVNIVDSQSFGEQR